LLARHIAPGRHRAFAFMQWPQFDRAAWQQLLDRADEDAQPRAPSSIQGSDRDAGAIEASCANADRAGVLGDIEFSQRAVSAIEPIGVGHVVTNPPYGQRVGGDGAHNDIRNLYAQFGKVLRAKCAGWHVALVAADAQVERSAGFHFERPIFFSNGGIKVRFVQADVK
jgi:putative N6-adenine-specific DNA methylase